MLPHTRPQSSFKRPLTAVTRPLPQNLQSQQSTPNNNRQTLVNLIPDMPTFLTKSKTSSALLYSKFIMKGIKTNKIDLVKESFNMRKENLKYEKKMSLNNMKTLRSTRNSTKNEALKSIRNENNERLDFIQRTNQNSMMDDSKILNLQINNFFRINSNRNSAQQNQTERRLTNIQSEKMISRPKSAVTTPYKRTDSNRAQTANYQRKVPNSCNRDTFFQCVQFRPTVPQKNLLTIIQSERPGFGFTNFIQRNKRQLSASSKKTSIYLTGVDGNKIIDNLNREIRKIPAKKYEESLKCHAVKKSMPDMSEISEFQIERKKDPLSKKQIQDIKNTNKENSIFMKKNMPKQYQKYMEFLSMKENNYTEKDRLLLSVNLQRNQNEFGQINLNSKTEDQALDEARDYFNEYAHICEETEYYINKNLKKKQLPKSFNEVLHVENCRQLLELQNERREILLENQIGSTERLKQIHERMFEIVKILSFFKSKSEQVCYKIFNIPFQILSVEEDQTIIYRGDEISHFHIILNGSVVKNTRNQPNEEFQMDLTNPLTNLQKTPINEPQTYTNTLFDGESFGQPDNKFQTSHKHEFKAAQKVLLLKFSYLEYRKICSESQNILDRIQLLKDIFGSVPGCKSLNNENLEALAFQLESSAFDAKNVIFRKEDVCDKLIIVASGKISKLNEHILKRLKKNSKDMKKKNKSGSKLKVKNYSVQKLRRNNLKNYEILTQNEEQFIFYYQDVSKQLIRGDVVNWEGFSHVFRKTLADQQRSSTAEHENEKPETSQYKLPFSLVSNTDNTKIYTLNMRRIQNLPQILKEVIYAKIDDSLKKEKISKKPKNQSSIKLHSIQKWDEYKQKICNDIIGRKLKV